VLSDSATRGLGVSIMAKVSSAIFAKSGAGLSQPLLAT